MSGKPDDIPQDVWDDASEQASRFFGTGLTVLMARAILAERERCAKLADSYIDTIDIAHFIRTGRAA